MENWSDIPVCSNRSKAGRVCVSFNCNRLTPYQCMNQECSCYFQHKDCQTMNWSSIFKLTSDYKNKISNDIKQHIQRFEKIYMNLKEKINKQLSIFKRNYQKIIFGDSLQKINVAIQTHKLSDLRSKDFNSFLQSFQKLSQLHFTKISLKEAKQIDSKILQLFSKIQVIYKAKIIKKNQTPQHIRPFSSLQKSMSNIQIQQNQISHKRTSSVLTLKDFQYANKSQILTKKIQLSQMLQKKLATQAIKSICKPPKIDLKYPLSISSQIVQNSSLLNEFIGKKIYKYKLLYRASQNNFSIDKFYKQVQKYYASTQNKSLIKTQKGTLLLLKTQYGKVLGGYTELIWKKNVKKNQIEESSDQQSLFNPQNNKISKYKEDYRGSTFLFSLHFGQKYNLLNPQKSIYCGSKSIGFGEDLRIKQNANQFRQNICNYSRNFKETQFEINKKQKCLEMIGSRYSRKFKIIQWQAFGVQFEQQLIQTPK